MLARLAARSCARSSAAAASRTAWPRSCGSTSRSTPPISCAVRRAAGGGRAPRAHGVRQRRQRQGRLPRGARPPPRSTSCGRTLRHAVRLMRRTPGFTATAAGHARPLPRRQPHDLRRRRLGAAAAAAVPGRRPAGERLQHLSEGRRAERRLLADELLRAPRQDRRLLPRGGVPRRHVDRRRDRRHRARSRSRACRRSSSRRSACCRPSDARSPKTETDLPRRRRRRADGRLLAAAPGRRPERARTDDSRGRRADRRSSACCRRSSASSRRRRSIYFPLASNPEERSPQQRHSGNVAT